MITNRQDKRLEVAKMVRLDDDVHDQLTNLDKKNESYSDVVKRLIESYKRGHKSEVS
jgi:predicted CopG family antitoxin